MGRRVAIVGVGISRIGRRSDVSHPELAAEAVTEVLEKSRLTIDEVDAVVYGTMDPFDGILLPERWDSVSLGAGRGSGKPIMKISTGGTTGISVAISAYYHVASGLHDVVMAVGVQKVSETAEAQQVLNVAVDPIYDKPFGVGAICVGAFQASAYMAEHDERAEEHMAMVAVKNRLNGLRNPKAHLKLRLSVEEALNSPYLIWPIKLLDSCPSSDGSVAVIFASEEKARKITDNPAWVRAVGYLSDLYWVGPRDNAFWDSLAILARRVYRKAGIANPLREIDVAELYEAFTIQEILEYEALGFAGRGQGWRLIEDGVTNINGELPCDPSGGVLSSNPVGATGLVRVAEAAKQIMGDAGEHQVADAETALAHAWGGSLQFHGLMILDRNLKRA